MKNLLVITVLALSLTSFQVNAQCCATSKSEKTGTINNLQTTKTVKFKISGITCAGCEEHINHEVNKLKGIVSSKASYENGNAIIEFDRTKSNEMEIEKVINSTGYKVTDKKEIK
nr:heavy metal-associated domain-containing protein [Gillisia sp. JM1]